MKTTLGVYLLCLVVGPMAAAQTPSGTRAAEKPARQVARSGAPAAAQKAPTLVELQTERRKLLEQLYQLVVERQRQGMGKSGDVAAARLTLLEADLEMTADRTKRIALREEVVRIRREQEETVRANVQSGVATAEEMVKAKITRLDAEIALKKELATRQ